MIQYIPAALSIVGSLTESEGAREVGQAASENGKRRRVAAEFEAEQLEVLAGQKIAAAQRDAYEERRKATLVQSRALALAAASGASASDSNVVSLLANTAGEGAYRAAVALYQGEDAARTARLQASARRYEGWMAEVAGEDTQEAYETKATGSLLSGAGSLFAKYGTKIGGASDVGTAAASAAADTSSIWDAGIQLFAAG